MTRFTILILISIFNFSTLAQTQDSLKNKKLLANSILPTTMIASGLFLNNSITEYNLKTSVRKSLGTDFYFGIDDYTVYAPVTVMYIADLSGIKSRNHWFDQTKYLFISNIISSVITHSLKNIIVKTRPNGDAHSFPSGHTTVAFTNATVLYNEFSESSPIIAYSGYAFAITTGSFRVMNNKHWISDVLVGAGIGILSTNLVYYFEPFKNFNPLKKTTNISFIPTINKGNYGFYFSYKFI